MKESLVHCYDYLLSDDSGRTPFGEKAANPRACAKAFERESGKFEMLPCGVSRHEFRKGGKEFVVYLNTTGESVSVPGTNLTVAPRVVRVYPLP